MNTQDDFSASLLAQLDALYRTAYYLTRDTALAEDIGDDGKRHAILWRHDDTGVALVADLTVAQEELLPLAAQASQQTR